MNNITSYIYRTLRLIFIMTFVIAILVASIFYSILWYKDNYLPSVQTLEDVRFQIPLRIYSKNDELIAEYGKQRRIPIPMENMPSLMVKAILAVEDDQFYEHPGVDFKALVRAVVYLVKKGGAFEQGGSTITMQVARNFFLTEEGRTIPRKFNEILLALKIEQELSKDEILELYLNKIFFGHRAYGIGAAAYVYYGKKVGELTLAEFAMLAGIPKAPSSNNPVTNHQKALERRNFILKRMLTLKYINTEQYKEAVNATDRAKLRRANIELKAPYVADMVRGEMEKRYSDNAFTNGYKVFTTIDGRLQMKAQEALRNALYHYDERHGYRGPAGYETLPEKPTEAELQKILRNHRVKGTLLPSIVLEVKHKSVVAYNQWAKKFEISWKHLSWARRSYVNTNRRSGKTGKATNILKRGDIIMVRNIRNRVYASKKDQINGVKPTQRKPIWQLSEVPQVEGALVALDPNDGAIIALAGGFDFYHSKFNRVTQALRQPGSNFKPFVYSAALANGYTAASVINDSPLVFKVGKEWWRPENYGHRFYGPTRLREALAKSRNIVSIRILKAVGVSKTIAYAQKFGFDKKRIPPNFTTALGTGEVTPLELVKGFAVFANGGYLVDDYFIQRIEDAEGNILFEEEPRQVCRRCPPIPVKIAKAPEQEVENTKEKQSIETNDKGEKTETAPASDTTQVAELEKDKPIEKQYAPQAITPENAWIMTSILKDVIRRGTATTALKLGRDDIAGKTGTTNGPNDAWFSGYTPNVVATAWVGFDQPRALGKKETGGKAALPMWIEFMKEALKGKRAKNLRRPKNIVKKRIDSVTGLLASRNSSKSMDEFFAKNNVPKKYAHYRPKPKSSSSRGRKYAPGGISQTGDISDQLF